MSSAYVMRAQKTSKQPISQPTALQHEFRMLAIKPYFVRDVIKQLIYKGQLNSCCQLTAGYFFKSNAWSVQR
jgi:hypothetical protein